MQQRSGGEWKRRYWIDFVLLKIEVERMREPLRGMDEGW
jgi:hypothetical protein